MSQDPSSIVKMFNSISPTYDRVNFLLSFGQDAAWRKKMAEFLPNKKGLIHLDLATGTADQIISLWECSPSISRSVGIDPADKMLKIASKKIHGKSYEKNIEFKVGVAEKIPYPENTFDAATISFGIRNTEDPLLSLQEMHRVLKPKGRALILEFSLPKNTLTRALHLFYLRRLVPKIGGFVSKSPSSYRYLNQTIESFPYGMAFIELMQKAGFQKTKAHPLSFGAVSIYIGEKK